MPDSIKSPYIHRYEHMSFDFVDPITRVNLSSSYYLAISIPIKMYSIISVLRGQSGIRRTGTASRNNKA